MVGFTRPRVLRSGIERNWLSRHFCDFINNLIEDSKQIKAN